MSGCVLKYPRNDTIALHRPVGIAILLEKKSKKNHTKKKEKRKKTRFENELNILSFLKYNKITDVLFI